MSQCGQINPTARGSPSEEKCTPTSGVKKKQTPSMRETRHRVHHAAVLPRCKLTYLGLPVQTHLFARLQFARSVRVCHGLSQCSSSTWSQWQEITVYVDMQCHACHELQVSAICSNIEVQIQGYLRGCTTTAIL